MMKAALKGLGLAAIIALSACSSIPNSSDIKPDVNEGPDTLAETNLKLGIGYLQQGQRDLALSKLQRAIELDPKLAKAHYAIAILYDQLGQTDLALQHAERAVSLDPQDSAAHLNYGTFLCKQNQLDKADEQFQMVFKNPLYASPEAAYENAGVCAMRVPDPAKAEQYFRSALQLNPKLPITLYQMAVLHYQTERYLQARAYLQRYAEVSQHTPQSLWLGIKVERQLGDRNTASGYALQLKSKFPDSEEVHLLLESEKGAKPKSP
jgi:type IV pilus assembly protein PilF